MLRVLHPVDKITADDLRYIRIWKIWTNYISRFFLFTEDLLIALGSTDMLATILFYKVYVIKRMISIV